MSRLIYFLVPIGIVLLGGWVINENQTEPVTESAADLRHLSGHLAVLDESAPFDLYFAGERVPMERKLVEKRMTREINANTRYPDGTILTFKRMYRYKEEFLAILKEYGVPEDFFYLAVAESRLSNATSHVGAQGFWQFMKPTAKAYGLEVSASVDERFHPVKATRAAARYLRDAHKRLGNWTLVAASYNMGVGGISKAMRVQGQNSYYDLALNKETTRYLYRIIGFKTILENPFQYGFNLKEQTMYRPIPYRTMRVTENIPDLVTFAREHGVSYRDLKIMNPWLISDHLKVKKGKSYEIRFPAGTELFANELLVDDPARLDSIDAQAAISGPIAYAEIERPALP